jgi:ABC-type transport system involved in multi-copper enzyme maturation permease subunit
VKLDWHRVRTIAITDLRQLWQSPDFWVPMLVLAALFFVLIPLNLLFAITRIGDIAVAQKMSQVLDVLPKTALRSVAHRDPSTQTAYALAVYLFAPLAVIVPMTVSTAVGAAAVVGEREKGTGEFLAHSPAAEREIYLGKVIAALVPGYLTALIGFGAYSVMVNLVVGPKVGGWFFPTRNWWLLMLWVIPPFLALTLSIVLRLSARVRSAAAAQQASGLVTLPLILLSFGQSSGALLGRGSPAVVLGAVTWCVAGLGLARGGRSVRRPRLLGVDAA